MKHERRDHAQEIVDQIVELLSAGTLPWKACWDHSGRSILPLRVTGQPYSGVNFVALLAAALKYGHSTGTWVTFRQALSMGGNVKKGERGRPVCFYGALDRPADNGAEDMRTIRYLRFYTVFNAGSQTENLPPRFYETPKHPAPASLPDIEAWIDKLGADIRWGGVGAYYDPCGGDYVRMPSRERFNDGGMMMSTLLHELIHWTGAEHRLNRLEGLVEPAQRAREELVAELGAAMLGSKFGLPSAHIDDHASYIQGWLSYLKDEPKALFSAAAKAQAAVNFLEQLGGPIAGESAMGSESDDAAAD